MNLTPSNAFAHGHIMSVMSRLYHYRLAGEALFPNTLIVHPCIISRENVEPDGQLGCQAEYLQTVKVFMFLHANNMLKARCQRSSVCVVNVL